MRTLVEVIGVERWVLGAEMYNIPVLGIMSHVYILTARNAIPLSSNPL